MHQPLQPRDAIPDDDCRFAFRKLAALDVARQNRWIGPSSSSDLEERVKFLAWSWGMVSAEDMPRIGEVLRRWYQELEPAGPSSTDEMKLLARKALQPRGIPSNDVGLQKALSAIYASPRASDAHADNKFDPVAQAICANAISRWHHLVLTDTRWNALPSVTVEEQPTPIADVYIDLFITANTEVPEQELIETDRLRRLRSSSRPIVSIPTMLARTPDRAIIVGEPGSGKSTLVKWIAWSIAQGNLKDFDLSIVVRLGSFARAFDQEGEKSPINFFFQKELALNPEHAFAATAHLRQSSRQNRRILLLLDGWDEVALSLRDRLRPVILEEAANFTTVITSRPSGVPNSLRDSRTGQIYEIVGLSARTLERFARRQFERAGRLDRLPIFLQQISQQPDLRDLCGNPFLLTLICRVAASAAENESDLLPRTRAAVYERAVEWMRMQYNLARETGRSCFRTIFLRLRSFHMTFSSRVQGRPTSSAESNFNFIWTVAG